MITPAGGFDKLNPRVGYGLSSVQRTASKPVELWLNYIMHWTYLSPHLDDVALSCGGLVWEQTQSGAAITILTVCAGDPPTHGLSPFAESLHARWETDQQAAGLRRREDQAACAILGAAPRHLDIPDCIYRQAPGSAPSAPFLYDSEESLFGPLHPAEENLVAALSALLAGSLPADSRLVCPLTLGGHVDHRLTRAAAERLGRPLWYYPDFPYALDAPDQVAALPGSGLAPVQFPISEPAMRAWEDSVAAHTSQISTFWNDLDAMRRALRAYCHEQGGVQLWRSMA